MKKVFLSALAIVMFGSFAANAQSKKTAKATKTAAPAATVTPAATPAPAPEAAVVATADNRTKVTAEELPAPVKATLATDAFKAYQVSNAYLVKAETEYYEIEALKGEEKATLKFDKEGKAL